jgi:hypothetical protein
MDPDQYLPWVIPVFAALVGGIASFLASYEIEKRKWRAEAAINRKATVYSPIYEELLSLRQSWCSMRYRSFGLLRPRLQEWGKKKESAVGLTIPRALIEKMNLLGEITQKYDEAYSALSTNLQMLYPERHVDRNDYGVLLSLADFLILGLDDWDLLYSALRDQSPSSPDPAEFWSTNKLVSAQAILVSLSTWNRLRQLDREFLNQLDIAISDLELRIVKISEKFEAQKSKL